MKEIQPNEIITRKRAYCPNPNCHANPSNTTITFKYTTSLFIIRFYCANCNLDLKFQKRINTILDLLHSIKKEGKKKK